MEIYNTDGQRISPGLLVEDIKNSRLTTQEIIEKRKLSYSTREEFLADFEIVTKKDPSNFRNCKRILEKSDKGVEKLQRKSEKLQAQAQSASLLLNEEGQQRGQIVQKAENEQEEKDKQMEQQQVQKQPSELQKAEKKKESILKEIARAEKKLEKHEKQFQQSSENLFDVRKEFAEIEKKLEEAENELKKRNRELKESEKKIADLNINLKNIETEIEILRSQRIYLVSPRYVGEIPQYGRFISTEEVSGLVVEIDEATNIESEPELKDMIKAGYDSVQEYMKGLNFVSLVEEYSYGDEEFEVLVSDEKIKLLLKNHIGGDVF